MSTLLYAALSSQEPTRHRSAPVAANGDPTTAGRGRPLTPQTLTGFNPNAWGVLTVVDPPSANTGQVVATTRATGTAGKNGQQDAAEQPQAVVARWAKVMLGLFPAEILALHAVLMSLGTAPVGDGTTRVISSPEQVAAFYVALLLLTFPLCAAAQRGPKKFWDVATRGLIAAGAFLAWSLLQPQSGFDALGFNVPELTRVMSALLLALVLAEAARRLEAKQTQTSQKRQLRLGNLTFRSPFQRIPKPDPANAAANGAAN